MGIFMHSDEFGELKNALAGVDIPILVGGKVDCIKLLT
jgi:hypothetical protein